MHQTWLTTTTLTWWTGAAATRSAARGSGNGRADAFSCSTAVLAIAAVMACFQLHHTTQWLRALEIQVSLLDSESVSNNNGKRRSSCQVTASTCAVAAVVATRSPLRWAPQCTCGMPALAALRSSALPRTRATTSRVWPGQQTAHTLQWAPQMPKCRCGDAAAGSVSAVTRTHGLKISCQQCWLVVNSACSAGRKRMENAGPASKEYATPPAAHAQHNLC